MVYKWSRYGPVRLKQHHVFAIVINDDALRNWLIIGGIGMSRRPMLGNMPAHARRGRWTGTVVAAVFATQLIGSAAFADQLEEIVVTAQKRTENVQKVPIAITAFTAETIQSKGLNNLHALSNLTPNVNLDGGAPFSGDSSVLSASIRGIGQDDFAFNLDPGVGVYLDGVYLARTIGANQNLLDVDRIEILKGPQGTLFGRNTIGGAINIVTHTPGNESKISGSMTLGAYNRHDCLLTADMPISDTLLTTVSVSSQTREGYQKVVPYPADSPMGTTPYHGLRASRLPEGPRLPSPLRQRRAECAGASLQDALARVGYVRPDSRRRLHAREPVGPPQHHSQRHHGQCHDLPSIPIRRPRGAVRPEHHGQLLQHVHHHAGFGARRRPVQYARTACAARWPWARGTRATGKYGARLMARAAQRWAAWVPCGVPNSVLAGLLAAYPRVAPYVTQGANGYGSVVYPGQTPRIYWNFANTQTGNIDTTYANGPSFAKYDSCRHVDHLGLADQQDLKFKSITGCARSTGTSASTSTASPSRCRKSPTASISTSSRRNSS